MDPTIQKTSQELKSVIEKGTAAFFVANGVTKVIAISNSLLVLSALTAYAYGVAELALSVVGALSIFQLPGLERTVTTDMGVERGAGNHGVVHRLFRDFMLILSALGIVAWALLFFVSDFVGKFFTPEIGSYFIIISFVFLSAPLTAAMRMLFSVYFDFTATALFTFLQEATKLIFLIGLHFWSDITIAGLLWAYVFAQCAPVVLLFPRTYTLYRQLGAHPVQGTFSPQRFIYGHNFWTMMTNYLDSLTRSMRLWLIKFFLGTEAVALFAVAQGIVGQLSSFRQITAVVTPILPQYVHDRPIFYRIVDKTIKYQLLSALVLIVAGMIGIPILVDWLFPQYESALGLFAILVFVLIPTSMSGVLQILFYILKAQRSLFFSQALRFFMVLILSVILIPLFGLVGVAIEYILNAIFFCFERYRVLRKLYPDFFIDPLRLIRYDEYDRMLVKRLRARVFGMFTK